SKVSRSKLAEPPTHGARSGQPLEAAQSQDDRIIEVQQMAQPPAAADQQSQEDQDHRRPTEVASWQEPAEFPPQHRGKPDDAEVASNELQPSVRSEALVLESQLKIAVDPPPQIRSSPPHWEWPFVAGESAGSQPRIYHKEGHSHSFSPLLTGSFSSHQG